LKINLSSCTHDLIALTETNLTPDIAVSELGSVYHKIYRCDRSVATSSKTSGGGVLIAVDSKLHSVEIPVSPINYECLFVQLTLSHNAKLLIGCVYIPPNMSSEVYSNFSNTVESILTSCSPDTHLILIGDFNLPEVDWDTPSLPNASSQTLFQLISLYNLRQYNNISNHRGVLLDLLFSSIDTMNVQEDILPLVPAEIHHPALIASFRVGTLQKNILYSPCHDFRRCDLEKVSEE
jgi:hypothetical protein